MERQNIRRQRMICSPQTLLKIIEHKDDSLYNSVNAVMNICDVCIEASKEYVIALKEEDVNFKKFFHERPPFCIESIKKEIENPLVNDIFILDSSFSKNLENLRKSKGLLIINVECEMEILDKICHTHYQPLIFMKKNLINSLKLPIEFENIRSWKDVFKKLKVSPINSAIIVDNYIFGSKSNNILGDNKLEDSIKNLISELVPSGLKDPFHLTFFIYNCWEENQRPKEYLRKIIEKIKELRLDSEIRVSIIAHDSKDIIHDRVILTNYHLITLGYGFAGMGNRNTWGEIVSILYNNESEESFTNKQIHTTILKLIKRICGKIKDGCFGKAFEVVDDEEDKFTNRLLSENCEINNNNL